MTKRQQEIIKALLQVLSDMDGHQLAETVLHAEVTLRLAKSAGLAEFNDALQIADTNGWVVSVHSRFGKGRLLSLSDAGEAARLEMR
jgi:hypothetical protein